MSDGRRTTDGRRRTGDGRRRTGDGGWGGRRSSCRRAPRHGSGETGGTRCSPGEVLYETIVLWGMVCDGGRGPRRLPGRVRRRRSSWESQRGLLRGTSGGDTTRRRKP